MPTIALFRSPSVDQTRYDAIVDNLDLERLPVSGIVSHVCGFDRSGICVLEVWESRSDLDAFLNDRLRPAFARLGFEFAEPEIMDVYRFAVSEDAASYPPDWIPESGASATDRGLGPSQ